MLHLWILIVAWATDSVDERKKGTYPKLKEKAKVKDVLPKQQTAVNAIPKSDKWGISHDSVNMVTNSLGPQGASDLLRLQ